MDDRESEGRAEFAIGDRSNTYRGLDMTVEINVLSDALRAEVVGLDLSSPVAESDVAAIQRAF